MKTVVIDVRVLGFGEKPCRILSACSVGSGLVSVLKEGKWTLDDVLPKNKDNTVVVTDATEIIPNWHLSFNAKDQLEDVINLYQLRSRAKLIKIDPTLTKYSPDNVLQIRKVDKNGLQQEFDSSMLNNGHVAVLLSVWAGFRIAQTNSMNEEDEPNTIDSSMMPFSI